MTQRASVQSLDATLDLNAEGCEKSSATRRAKRGGETDIATRSFCQSLPRH